MHEDGDAEMAQSKIAAAFEQNAENVRDCFVSCFNFFFSCFQFWNGVIFLLGVFRNRLRESPAFIVPLVLLLVFLFRLNAPFLVLLSVP